MNTRIQSRKSWVVVLASLCVGMGPGCDRLTGDSTTPSQNKSEAGGADVASNGSNSTGGGDRASIDPGRLPIGPYRMVTLSDGTKAPWYLLPFDKDGVCEAPLTRTALVESLKSQKFTDVFLFSHGWNNDWDAANRLYDGWLKGFIRFRADHPDLGLTREFRPLFIGVIWPSTALVLPSEQGPGFRSVSPGTDDYVGQERDEIRSLAESIPGDNRDEFYKLTQRPEGGSLNDAEALRLAQILAPLFVSHDPEIGDDSTPPDPADLVAAWKKLGEPSLPSVNASRMEQLGRERSILSRLDPRWIVRVGTVWQMKDRAGVVGGTGVGPLLREILAYAPTAAEATAGQKPPRVHLLGHSFGAKVVLSALCQRGVALARKVNSVLLLQPAISYLCFDPNAAGAGTPGGYAAAPDRSEQPILSTFSGCDDPLTKFFHLALRRTSDLGERSANAPPSIYSALGGFGPAIGEGVFSVKLVDYPTRYPITEAGRRIIGIDGTPPGGNCNNPAGIDGHGDVSNVHTYWMLYNQLVN